LQSLPTLTHLRVGPESESIPNKYTCGDGACFCVPTLRRLSLLLSGRFNNLFRGVETSELQSKVTIFD
jgi:hypothetical protein